MKHATADIRVKRFASSTHQERFAPPIESLMMLPGDYSCFEAAVSSIDQNLASKSSLAPTVHNSSLMLAVMFLTSQLMFPRKKRRYTNCLNSNVVVLSRISNPA